MSRSNNLHYQVKWSKIVICIEFSLVVERQRAKPVTPGSNINFYLNHIKSNPSGGFLT